MDNLHELKCPINIINRDKHGNFYQFSNTAYLKNHQFVFGIPISAKDVHFYDHLPASLHLRCESVPRDNNIFFTIEGLPLEAKLSKGENIGYGNWQLEKEDLDDLTLSLPAYFTGLRCLSFTATVYNHKEFFSSSYDFQLFAGKSLKSKSCHNYTVFYINFMEHFQLETGEKIATIILHQLPKHICFPGVFQNEKGKWIFLPHQLEEVRLKVFDDKITKLRLDTEVNIFNQKGQIRTETKQMCLQIDTHKNEKTFCCDQCWHTKNCAIYKQIQKLRMKKYYLMLFEPQESIDSKDFQLWLP